MESSSDSDQEINANIVFMAQIKKLLSDSEASSSSADEKISEVESESESEFETLEYYDNSTNYGLFVNNDDDQEIFHDAIESASENFIDNHIDSQKYYDKSDVDHNDSEEIDHLIDKLIRKFNKKIVKCQKRFVSSENVCSESENQSENDFLVVEKECDKEENPKVIYPGMFKLSVSHSISLISMSKSSCDSNNVEIKLKRKRRKRKSSKQNAKQVDNDVSRANTDFVHFLDLDTFCSVRRPKNSDVVWKKKGSSNTSKVDLSVVRISNLNKNVKRYSHNDLLACNNSHLGETRSAFVCNDAMNVSCDSRMNDLLDDNNFFIFDDESVRIYPVSKMPFRKKPRDSMNVRSKSNSNKSVPRTVRCSKHMTGNRALLTNFVEKFLRMVRFGNNDFGVIAGYRDVVIGSMTIKKVYYVEGLGHNLFSVEQFVTRASKSPFESLHSLFEMKMV
uniref:Integrase, catalytic region, zinc finger, CCHC-type, peptidase aspartic, catalytic n=1 Tax=Tanacetum cinerariifolium TaxID=118510 RepID=A0A699JK60_TANCI|nr:integrase, catalytic region, zinc finger, CCHC-type, peptidase aspartic, catalytic [Tanacetum cinerariifolium]